MGQLIAIILAVILGAFAAILQIVNLGSGYANKSADVVAQHFLQHASTLESAMAVYNAEEAASAFSSNMAGTITNLTDKDLVKETPAPVVDNVTFELAKTGTEVHMSASGTGVSSEICTAFSELKGSEIQSGADFTVSDLTKRYGCVEDTTADTRTLFYRVE